MLPGRRSKRGLVAILSWEGLAEALACRHLNPAACSAWPFCPAQYVDAVVRWLMSVTA